MAEEKTSGTLHDDRLTPQVCGAASGGASDADKDVAVAPHQWTLQHLIAVIKGADQKRRKIGPQ